MKNTFSSLSLIYVFIDRIDNNIDNMEECIYEIEHKSSMDSVKKIYWLMWNDPHQLDEDILLISIIKTWHPAGNEVKNGNLCNIE